MRSAYFSLLFASLFSTTACFNYLPPVHAAEPKPWDDPSPVPEKNMRPAPVEHLEGPQVEDPDAVAVYDKWFGDKKGSGFTFVDGAGRELTPDELSARLKRVTGEDGLDAQLRKNHILGTIGAIGVSAALTTLVSFAIAHCTSRIPAPSDCTTPSAERGLVLGTATTALLDGVTVYFAFQNPRASPALTRDQAEELAAKYNAAVRDAKAHDASFDPKRQEAKASFDTKSLTFHF